MVLIVATGIAISTVWMRQRERRRAAGPAAGGRGEPVNFTSMAAQRLGIDVGGSSIKAGAGGYRGRAAAGGTHLRAHAAPGHARGCDSGAAGAGGADFGPRRPVGVAFPSVIKNGSPCTAANIDSAWIGAAGRAAAGARHRRAGRVSQRCRCGRTRGDALGRRPRLRRHRHHGDASEPASAPRCSATAGCSRTPSSATWKCAAWTRRSGPRRRCAPWRSSTSPPGPSGSTSTWRAMQRLFWPDVFILGGAVSERFAEFAPLLRSPAELRRAQFGNQAGVIGAALAAAEAARLSVPQQAARRRHHDLHGHVAARARARCAQSRPGVPRLRHRPAADGARGGGDARRSQPVRADGGAGRCCASASPRKLQVLLRP